MSTYLIVPSQGGAQCRIVRHDKVVPNALRAYREDHEYDSASRWREVGLMNSRGDVVCLDAPADLYTEMLEDAPLMAGATYYR